jgi:hypothetical protein
MWTVLTVSTANLVTWIWYIFQSILTVQARMLLEITEHQCLLFSYLNITMLSILYSAYNTVNQERTRVSALYWEDYK